MSDNGAVDGTRRVTSVHYHLKLERMSLPLLPKLSALPDMVPLPNLVDFVIVERARLCYNGFLDGQCNSSKPACRTDPLCGLPLQVECLPANRTDHIATNAAHSLFTTFASSACIRIPTIITKEDQSSLLATMGHAEEVSAIANAYELEVIPRGNMLQLTHDSDCLLERSDAGCDA